MKIKNNLIIMFTSFLLFSCSSGSDPVVDDPDTPIGGVVRTGIAYGPISGFGSVIVNGVHYDTSSASFDIDDGVGSESDLKVGQVVTMKTETDDQANASATSVSFDDVVEGPIASIDLATNSLVVLGQAVMINGGTSFDDNIFPASLEGLIVGNVIEVSGLYDANDLIQATRIELKTSGNEFEVHGTVSELDTATLTFMLNDLAVDYVNATLDDFGGDSLSNGDVVEAKGTSLGINNELIATKVELENSIEDTNDDERVGDDGDDAEIEGLITVFNSSADFFVAGIPVITTSSTVFDGGIESDLALNVRIEAEGEFNANGVLVADEIEFEQEASLRIRAPIDSVNSTTASLTVLGVEFVTDTSTRFEDQSEAEVEQFSFSNLNAGDYVEVRGFLKGEVLYASQVERDDLESTFEMQGFVESIGTSNDLAVLGITITTDTSTSYQDFDESTLSQNEFFNLLAVGSLVKAEGTVFSGNSLLAEDLEFEIDN